MKDSWQVLLDDIAPEGHIYDILNQKNVPNVPRCSRAGDVGDDAFHKSRTHDFVDICVGKCRPEPEAPISKQFVAHRHYRLVLDNIGRELEDFKTSREMVKAVYASLVGK